MSKSLSTRFLKSSLLRTVETVIAIVVGLFMLPFMVTNLGDQLYGIWIIVSSVTSTLYIFDLGFATAVTRYISKHLAIDDRKAASSVVSTALFIYTLLALIILSVTVAASFSASFFTDDMSNERLVQLLILITGLNIAIEFPFKAYAGIASYHLRYDLLALSRIIFKLLSTAAIVWAVLSGYQLLTIAIIGLFASLFSNITFYFIAKHLEPNVGFNVKYISKDTLKSLSSFSAWAFFIDIARLAKERGDIWVIGYFLVSAQLTVYYVALRLVEYATQFLSGAVSMTMPLLAADYAKNDLVELINKIFLFTRLNTILAIMTVSGFVLFAEEFFKLWMGNAFQYETAYFLCLIVLIGKLTAFASAPICGGFMAINKPKPLAAVSASEGVASLILTILFVNLYGLKGAAIGSAVPFLCTRTYLVYYLLKQHVNFSILEIYRHQFKSLVILSIPFLITFYIKEEIIAQVTIFKLSLLLCLFLIMFYLVLPLLFSATEKKALAAILPTKIYKILFGLSSFIQKGRKEKAPV